MVTPRQTRSVSPAKKSAIATGTAAKSATKRGLCSNEKVLSEDRSFRMHTDLLYSVIRRQAGSVDKAILELVMNSVDAGASRVEVTLNAETFSVMDDGRGFRNRQEIDDFFETFGTPHEEGDAYYGRFRMGRGQIMAFSKNVWRSGEFRMTVDIKNRGLDYILETGLEPAAGCSIEGRWESRLTEWELSDAQKTLATQCKYVPIPVLVNGAKINVNTAEEKWTIEDAYALYRVDEAQSTIKVYNRGVLVQSYRASISGVGGIVVSKLPLTVNFARNDILESECPVWRHILGVLRKQAHKAHSKTLNKPHTNEWRDYQGRLMIDWDGDPKIGKDLASVPILTDLAGRHWSFIELANDGRSVTEGAGTLSWPTVSRKRVARSF
jgi:hypothetical protein